MRFAVHRNVKDLDDEYFLCFVVAGTGLRGIPSVCVFFFPLCLGPYMFAVTSEHIMASSGPLIIVACFFLCAACANVQGEPSTCSTVICTVL